MARFRSGTLDRSLRRWGPKFPNPNKFQRKQHSWKYIHLNEQAMNLTNDPLEVTIVDSADWGDLAGQGVRNMSADLVIGVTWAPQTTALSFDSNALLWGIFCMDTEEPAALASDSFFSEQRAVVWDYWPNLFIENAESQGVQTANRYRTRVRFRQRWMKFNEELRLSIAFVSSVASVVNDARCFVFGRLSWETV